MKATLSKVYVSLLITLPIFIILLFYFMILNLFFFQDDFYEILISKAKNFNEFLSLFKFLENRSSYRPIGLQLYFFTASSLFGLNAIAFRTISLGFLIGSYFLIIKVIQKATGNFWVAILTASLWVLSSIHFMAITWIAAAWLIIGTFFFLASSFFFLEFSQKPKISFYLLALILFIFSLGSSEFSVSWPLIFGSYYILIRKQSIKKALWIISPFVLITIIYLILRLNLSSIPKIPEYQIAFDLNLVKSLFWYSLWTLNIPEEFRKQVVGNLLIFNKTFAREFWPLILKSFLSAFLIMTIGFIIPVISAIKRKLDLNWRLIFFGLIWFVVAIFPVLILPNHYFSMYLNLASIGLYLIIAYLSVKFLRLKFIIFLVAIWIFSSITTISFYKENSWMIESARFAKEFANAIKTRFPTLPQGAIVFFPLNDSRHIQALLDQNAARVIYNDPSLTIYYNQQELSRNLKEKETKKNLYIYK